MKTRLFRSTCNDVRLVLTAILFLSSTRFIQAQQPTVSATLDTNQITIGDWLQLRLEVNKLNEVSVTWPQLQDSIGGLEIIEKSKIDSVLTENQLNLSQTVTLTRFDSGDVMLPPIQFLFEKNGNIDSAFTDSFLIQVSTIPVDTSLPFKAIKEPMDVPFTFKEALPYIYVGLGILLLLALIYFLIKKFAKQKDEVKEKQKPKEPAHVIAFRKLKELEQKQLWQKEEIKQYYIELSDIVREYIENRYQLLALESTTDEIMDQMSRAAVDETQVQYLKEALVLSDLVKFAKAKPLPDEHVKTFKQMQGFVEQTKQERTITNKKTEDAELVE